MLTRVTRTPNITIQALEKQDVDLLLAIFQGVTAVRYRRSTPIALKELEARYATNRAKNYKLAGSEGFYLLVRPNDSKLGRFKYRFAGKEKYLAFGAYLTPRRRMLSAWADGICDLLDNKAAAAMRAAMMIIPPTNRPPSRLEDRAAPGNWCR